MLLLQAHYRGPVSVGPENLEASTKALAGLDAFAARTAAAEVADADETVLAQFRERMDDDLDTPGRDGAAVRHGAAGERRVRRRRRRRGAALVGAVHQMCDAFGLVLATAGDIPADATAKAAALDAARAAKDFAARRRAPRRAAGRRLDRRDHEGRHDPPPLTPRPS